MPLNILIYNSGGGLGDSIQLFPLILSLKNHFKKSRLYYLGAHENHYINKLKDFKISIETLDLNLKYFGFRWWHLFKVKKKLSELNINEFDLIIDLQSKLRNTIILKQIPTKEFYSSTLNFFFCSKKKKYLSKSRIVEKTINNLEIFFDTNIEYKDNVFEQIDNIYVKEAERLLPNKNYVALSITQGNLYRKKSWPINKVVDLAKKIVHLKKIPVFFIEKNDAVLKKKLNDIIPEALFPENETNLNSPALVACMGKRVNVAITIDNGVMHMLSIGKTPLVILFGPTDPKKFAPTYNAVKILDSKELNNTSEINSINVEDVLEAAKQYLEL